MKKKYRKNVAAVIINNDKEILACKRIRKNSKWEGIASPWQFPQGGIDAGETPEIALRRELLEEIGISKFEIIKTLEETIKYDWPESLHTEKHCGQEQCYFLISINDNQSINLNYTEEPEFDEYAWMSVDEFLKEISGFKAEAYREAIRLLIV